MFNISKEFAVAMSDLYPDPPMLAMGFDRENADLFNGLFIASGNRYFTPRNNGFPILNYNNDRTTKLIETISKIFMPIDDGFNERYMTYDTDNQSEHFKSGLVLFSASKLDMIPEITNSPFDWGLLPVPVMDPSAARYSFTDNNAMSMSVLRSARNTEACGIIISALSLASHKQLKDIYVLEQMLYTLRDVDSVNILSEIINNIAFSQYSAYSTMPEITNATAGILKTAVIANNADNFSDLYENGRRNLNDFFRASDIFQRR